MKSILLFFIITLFTTTLFAQIDERKTDVYFANGILTKSNDAVINANLLRDTIIAETYGGNFAKYKKHIGVVTTAYNNTHRFWQDITESVYQVLNTTEFIEWRDRLLGIYTQSAHQANIEDQVDAYEASIKSGHRVLVVAHSQGNLFTQEAYERLGDRSSSNNRWLQKYFEAISIASPDPITDIKPNMLPRIGWENDMVAIIGGSNNNPSNVRQEECSGDPDPLL